MHGQQEQPEQRGRKHEERREVQRREADADDAFEPGAWDERFVDRQTGDVRQAGQPDAQLSQHVHGKVR